MAEYVALIVLFALEHLAMCAPLLLLHLRLRERHNEMDLFFPRLPEEEVGMANVTALLVAGVLASVAIVPALQVFLLHLCYSRVHPLSTLLKGIYQKTPVEDSLGTYSDLPDGWFKLFLNQ